MTKAAAYDKSRNLRPKTQVAALFALWSAPSVAILFTGCHSRIQKAFSFCSLVCAEWGSPYFAGTVCQMFFAYSFTALSAANLPEQAVFISDIEFQRVLSAQSSSILFCA